MILRSSIAYGPGSKRIEGLVERVLTDPRARYDPLGDLYAQLIHVRDLAEVITQAGIRSEAANEIFNVAGMEVMTFRDLCNDDPTVGGASLTGGRSFPTVPRSGEVCRRVRYH